MSSSTGLDDRDLLGSRRRMVVQECKGVLPSREEVLSFCAGNADAADQVLEVLAELGKERPAWVSMTEDGTGQGVMEQFAEYGGGDGSGSGPGMGRRSIPAVLRAVLLPSGLAKRAGVRVFGWGIYDEVMTSRVVMYAGALLNFVRKMGPKESAQLERGADA